MRTDQRGVTLIEIVIAMGLSAFVILIMSVLIRNFFSSQNLINQNLEIALFDSDIQFRLASREICEANFKGKKLLEGAPLKFDRIVNPKGDILFMVKDKNWNNFEILSFELAYLNKKNAKFKVEIRANGKNDNLKKYSNVEGGIKNTLSRYVNVNINLTADNEIRACFGSFLSGDELVIKEACDHMNGKYNVVDDSCEHYGFEAKNCGTGFMMSGFEFSTETNSYSPKCVAVNFNELGKCEQGDFAVSVDANGKIECSHLGPLRNPFQIGELREATKSCMQVNKDGLVFGCE